MISKRFTRIVSISLIASLILAGPVLGQEISGPDIGTGEVNILFQRPPITRGAVIQAENSDLFHPYIKLTANVRGAAVGVGDFNHDGQMDAAMTGQSEITHDYSLYIFLQNEYGHLSMPVMYPAGYRSESLAVCDLNHDGWDDVVTADFSDNTISVYLQQVNGTLSPRETLSAPAAENVVCGDFDGNGWDDIAIAQGTAAAVRVFYQQEEWPFMITDYSSPSAGFNDIDAGDLNSDTYMDVVKMNGQGMNPNLSVYLQDSSTHILSDPPDSYDDPDILLPNNIAAGDVNGDGRQDVVVTSNSPATLTVWAQNESGTLEEAATYTAYSSPGVAEIADVNGDGRNDVIIAHPGWLKLSVFLQNSGGSLNSYELYPLPYGPYYAQGMDIGDINHDGLPDVVLAGQNEGLIILYHKGSNIILDSSPMFRTVNNGASTIYQIRVLVPTGFSNPVTLDAQNLPAGVSASWSANPAVGPDYESTLTLNTSPGTASGDYSLTVTGTDGILEDQIQLGLKVNQLEMVFLPLIQRSKLILYKDDFSNMSSGWPIMANSIGIWNYVNGEYQLKILNPNYYIWSTAGHNPVNYSIQVDVRQVEVAGSSYGIMFGLNNDDNDLYMFLIDPDSSYQEWILLRYSGTSLYLLLGPYPSSSINTGTSSNHLEIVRKNNYVTFKINGSVVYTDYYLPAWSDNRRIGLVAFPLEDSGIDVRFDNYLVTEP